MGTRGNGATTAEDGPLTLLLPLQRLVLVQSRYDRKNRIRDNCNLGSIRSNDGAESILETRTGGTLLGESIITALRSLLSEPSLSSSVTGWTSSSGWVPFVFRFLAEVYVSS